VAVTGRRREKDSKERDAFPGWKKERGATLWKKGEGGLKKPGREGKKHRTIGKSEIVGKKKTPPAKVRCRGGPEKRLFSKSLTGGSFPTTPKEKRVTAGGGKRRFS